MSASDWALLTLLSLVWGGSFFLFEVALRELPPFTIVLGRVGIAAVILLAAVYASGLRMPTSARSLGGFLLLGGISNALPFSLIVWGQTAIPSGLASIFNATTPIFTVIIAHLVTRDDRMNPNRLLGIGLGLAGVIVLMGPDVLHRLDPYSLGQLAVLGAALCYGVATNFGRRFRDHPPLVNAAGMLSGATLWLLPVAAATERPWTLDPGWVGWSAILGLSLLCTALAFIIYFRLLASAGATNLSLVTFLVPVSAITLGSLFLGERLAPSAFFGLGMILLGLAAMDGRMVSRLRRRRLPSASRSR